MLILPRPSAMIPPATELTRALDCLIRDKRWTVKQVIGTHGRLGTMDDLARSLRLGSK